MVFVTVFRHVPRPITGMIGVLYDRTFEAFEANLDWLETTGVLVERFDPSTAPSEVTTRPVVQQLLSAEGDACLPLILVNNAVVSRGAHPSRTQLARAVGRGPATVRQVAVLGALAAVGSAEDLQSETTRARDLGIDEGAVRMATETGLSLRQRTRSAA